MSASFNRPPITTLKWVAYDLDGTLAESVWSADNPDTGIGQPIWRVVEEMRRVRAAGNKIVVWTARGWEFYHVIEAWLEHHGIEVDRIQPGKMLVRAVFDDRMYNALETDHLALVERH